MRFLLRLLGTWLLGAALILVIIDGTKSLAANQVVISSLGEAWRLLHAQSLQDARNWADSSNFGVVWQVLEASVLAWPGFAVLGVPGLVLAFAGRSRPTRERSIDRI